MTAETRAEQISVEGAAQAAGLAVETGTATVNGVTIYYRDIGPRAEPVILVHGFPETGDAFAPAVAALGKRYRLIVPDLRGAGRSQRAVSGYEKKTLATDLKALMEHLGIERAHVIGHDIGARIAYVFAVQYPERLLSLTVAEAFIEVLPALPTSGGSPRPIPGPSISRASPESTKPWRSTRARRRRWSSPS